MTLQINTFDDLLDIINTHPEWRQKLVKALFPDIDVAKALQELIETNRQMRVQLGDIDARLAEIDVRQARMEERQTSMEERQTSMEERQTRMEERQTRMEERQTRMEDWQTRADDRFERIDAWQTRADERFDRIDAWQTRTDDRLEHLEDWQTQTTGRLVRMERDIGDLKGDSYENGVIRRADAIFGSFLRRGRDGRQEVANQLEAAEDTGQITDRDYDLVFAADLLWNGRSKDTREAVTLVVEISWFAEQHDVDRAVSRAQVLRHIGLQAIPVVAAKVWPEELRIEALEQGVAIVDEYRADKASWEALLSPTT
ncbi:MAG: hypothetical protein KDE19_01500 [Caldilineaceae bacterium]|nr:hypothetical protein [Caldilineaceae bacterium]